MQRLVWSLVFAVAAACGSDTFSLLRGNLRVEPTRIDFGTLEVGTLAERTVILRNDGAGAVTVRGVSLNHSQAPDMGASGLALRQPVALQGGQASGIVVSFGPTAVGTQRASLIITADDGAEHTVSLLGHAALTCGDDLLCTPDALDMGSVGVGATSQASVLCRNQSPASITLTTTYALPPEVELAQAPADGTELASGQTTAYAFRYSPQSEGTHGGSFTIHSGACVQEVGLSGQGVAVDVPECIPPQIFSPVLKWSWQASHVEPNSTSVLMSPVVMSVNDDTGDGVIDRHDSPDIVFAAFDVNAMNYVDYALPPGTLRILDGRSGEETVSVPALVEPGVTPAVADLDSDGVPEIVTVKHHGSAITGEWQLIAIAPSGQVLWESAPYQNTHFVYWSSNIVQDYSAVAIADLDRDGSPEIVMGNAVFDREGQLLWQGTAGAAASAWGLFSVPADLDGDGDLEVVAGNTAYHHDGSVYWNTSVADGSVAIADCDGDAQPEVFIMSSMSGVSYSILEHDGSVRVASHPPPPDVYATWGSSVAAGDVDGDGRAEWVASFQSKLALIDCEGNLRWSVLTSDYSGVSGPIMFDFEGDGKVEVVFNDETAVTVYRGDTGMQIYSAPRSSVTGYETPVIADIDGDAHADLLITSDSFSGYPGGLRAYSNDLNNWVATRRVWNQHSYHVTHIEESGRVPANALPHWQADNLFRGNAAYCVPQAP